MIGESGYILVHFFCYFIIIIIGIVQGRKNSSVHIDTCRLEKLNRRQQLGVSLSFINVAQTFILYSVQ